MQTGTLWLMRQTGRLMAAFGLGLCSVQATANITCQSGGLCTQTLQLQPGWNAIHLQLTPDQDEPEALFAELLDDSGPKLESVWTWIAERAQVQFVAGQRTEDLLDEPGWLRYFPQSSGKGFLSNLFKLPGNRAYLIKLQGSTSIQFPVQGKPLPPAAEWEPDAFNFIGFHTDPGLRPSFHDFFSASPAHSGQPIYSLSADGATWEPVNPLTTLVDPGRAYWVWSQGGSDYIGPVALAEGADLDFSSILESLPLKFKNRSLNTRAVAIQMLANAQPVRHPNPDPASETPWLPLPLQLQLAADSTHRTRIGIRRAEILTSRFSEVLEIRSPGLFRWLIPVTADNPRYAAPVAARAGKTVQKSAPSLGMTGLWVGVVSIDQVEYIHNYKRDCPSDDEPPQPYSLCLNDEGQPILADTAAPSQVASPFTFRIILHQDDNGQVRLLKDVIQMTVTESTVDADGITHTSTTPVLLVDATKVHQYDGVSVRDGQPVGRRISTIAYDFAGLTLPLQGGPIGDQRLSAALTLKPEHPTNPFRHLYHPHHDDLDFDYVTNLSGAEVYEITRDISLEFTSPDANELGGGYSQLQGIYRETVKGLHKEPLFSAGRFTLRLISSVGALVGTEQTP